VTDEAIALLAPQIGTRAACAAAGVPQATWYRRHRISPVPQRPVPVPHAERVQPRALAPAERQAILDVLHSGRFADTAPAEVWAILLDEGTYLGSVSTYYRVLREAGESRERRRQATHPAAVKPELAADGPNQVWSWDITKLHGPAKWTYYHLYVILDIYSRYVVGWMVATCESAALAEKLIAATCAKQGIGRGQLSIHADRGSPPRPPGCQLRRHGEPVRRRNCQSLRCRPGRRSRPASPAGRRSQPRWPGTPGRRAARRRDPARRRHGYLRGCPRRR
jgi:putative transposase